MRKEILSKRIITALMFGLATVSASSTFAGSSSKVELNSVEACTRLLPRGHHYNLKMSMDIDTSKTQHKTGVTPYVISNGTITLTDGQGPGVPENAKKKVKPFSQCIIPLLKTAVKGHDAVAATMLKGESVLANALYNAEKTSGSVAKLAQLYYDKTAVEAAKVMRSAKINANTIAGVMKNGYQQSAENTARILRQVGESASDANAALQKIYRESRHSASNIVETIYKA